MNPALFFFGIAAHNWIMSMPTGNDVGAIPFHENMKGSRQSGKEVNYGH